MPSTSQPRAGSESVLETKAPAFSTAEAVEVAQRAFDIQASAHPLDSERDQNFRLRAGDGSEWVLKIANPAEDPAILDMQTQALLHIARVDPELSIPRVKTTPDGALFHQIDGSDGRRFIARVLTFLPGELLDHASPHPALARDVGTTTARLGRALRGFFHPAARHELLWDLTQAPELRSRTHHIGEPGQRRVVEKALDHFEAEVLPKLRKLRAQIIHNDISCLNTLVDGDRVTGVIDFGDLIHAPLIADIAVPICELIVQSTDPIATAVEIAAGYHAVTALDDDELRLVFDLVCTRSAMYVAIGNWRVGDHPENRDYIISGVQEYATLLEEMQGWESDHMYAGLRRACAMPISIAVPDFTRQASDEESLQLMLERRRQRLGPELELSYDRPLHVVRGEGVWLIDATGRSFLDAYNNVPQVGHCHPTVVQALAQQAATLNTPIHVTSTSPLSSTQSASLEPCPMVSRSACSYALEAKPTISHGVWPKPIPEMPAPS